MFNIIFFKSYIGTMMAKSLQRILDEYHLLHKVLAMTTDNVLPNDKQTTALANMKNLFDEVNCICCFNHTLQLSAKTLLRSSNAGLSQSKDDTLFTNETLSTNNNEDSDNPNENENKDVEEPFTMNDTENDVNEFEGLIQAEKKGLMTLPPFIKQCPRYACQFHFGLYAHNSFGPILKFDSSHLQ